MAMDEPTCLLASWMAQQQPARERRRGGERRRDKHRCLNPDANAVAAAFLTACCFGGESACSR
jgi:hypothetical protein